MTVNHLPLSPATSCSCTHGTGRWTQKNCQTNSIVFEIGSNDLSNIPAAPLNIRENFESGELQRRMIAATSLFPRRCRSAVDASPLHCPTEKSLREGHNSPHLSVLYAEKFPLMDPPHINKKPDVTPELQWWGSAVNNRPPTSAIQESGYAEASCGFSWLEPASMLARFTSVSAAMS
ncbi:unnamed protein product, partial [Ectocarpus sp. 8 AP-2014]